jgi:hypothetical protein
MPKEGALVPPGGHWLVLLRPPAGGGATPTVPHTTTTPPPKIANQSFFKSDPSIFTIIATLMYINFAIFL